VFFFCFFSFFFLTICFFTIIVMCI
jgi:hypothetical protein